MKSVLVVSNYNAGRKRAIFYKKIVHKFLLKKCERFKFITIDELEYIDFNEYDTVFVMGGDGTVNKILPYIVDTDKVLGIISCGTANLLAAKLGLSSGIKKTLKIFEQGLTKKIDVLKINDYYCVLRCGAGYDADIICKTPQSLKNKFGYFAYFISGILFALRLKKRKYNMTVNGQNINKNASCIIFANSANMYRNYFSLAENSLLDDGFADIFVLKTTNPIAFFAELIKVAFNIKKNSSRAEYLRGNEITVENSWLHCHIDGEKKNLQNNINIVVLDKAINVFTKN